MVVYERSVVVGATVEAVAAWHREVANLPRIMPPFPRVRVLEDAGDRVVLEVGFGPFKVIQVSRIENFIGPYLMVDVQEKGMFRTWRHEHHFTPVEGGRTRVRDRITAEWKGGLVDRVCLPVGLGLIFMWRHWRMRQIQW